mmetsp:Transcript_12145/g.37013  ORF Transcript_12145/g.37013 Transcript_12145/m.37013 type:complete len:445 (+) Transcript_12145:183-1517(+)
MSANFGTRAVWMMLIFGTALSVSAAPSPADVPSPDEAARILDSYKPQERVIAVIPEGASPDAGEMTNRTDSGVTAPSDGQQAPGDEGLALDASALGRGAPKAEKGLYVTLWSTIAVPAWMVGLFLGFTGYTLAGLGMNLIRLSHLVCGSSKTGAILDKLKETRFNRKASKKKATVFWSMGYLINSVGGTINSIGLKFTAQSLMAPLSSVALVSNAVFATYLNGETLRIRRDLGSILLIFIGNCITVSSGNHAGFRQLSLDEVALMWMRKSFIIYLGCICAVIVSMFVAYLNLKGVVEKEGGRERASASTLMKLGLCHAGGGCMLGVNSVLMAKSIMLVLAGGIWDNIFKPGFLLLSACWACAAGFWVYTLNKLLREYDALFIVPVIEVVWSLMSMVSGGIFFDEYRDLYGSRLLFFFVGVAFNVTGIWLIGHGKGGVKTRKTQV